MNADDKRTIALQNDIAHWEQQVKNNYNPYTSRMLSDARRKLQKHLSAMEKKIKKQLNFEPNQARLF